MKPVLIAACLGLALAAPAQQPAAVPEKKTSEPAPEELPPVVVEAERPPAERTASPEDAREDLRRQPGGVALADEKQIEQSRGTALHDVLGKIPGLLIRPRHGGASDSPQISIRGSGLRSNFHARGLSILVDGLAYGDADGFADFESFEPFFLKRIEVLKGPAAMRWGGSALGGAINMVQKTGRDAEALELRAQGGSFGYLKGYAATAHVLGPLDAYAGVTYTELRGYRRHAGARRTRACATVGYDLGNGGSLRLDVNQAFSDQDLPGSLTREEFRDDPRRAAPASVAADEERNFRYTRGAFTAFLPAGARATLQWGTQFAFQELDHPLSYGVVDRDTYNAMTELRYVLSEDIAGHANRFTAGLQAAGTRQQAHQYANVNGGHHGNKVRDETNEVAALALYVEEEFDVVPRLTAVAGARAQWSSRRLEDNFRREADADPDDTDGVRYFAVTPKAGLLWKPAAGIEVFGNAARGYEPPVLFELTAPGNLAGDFESLKPQRAWQFEVGTRGEAWKRVSWELSLYDIELRNELRNVNVAPWPGAPYTLGRYDNIARSRHQGIELGGEVVLVEDLAAAMRKGEGGGSLKAEVSYTLSRFRFVRDDEHGNNDLPGAPRHYVVAGLRYDHASGIWCSAGAEITPRGAWADSANTVRAPRSTIWNARAGYEYKPWKLGLFVEARNVADRRHVAALSVDSGNGRYFQPGDGRAFYAGIHWEW